MKSDEALAGAGTDAPAHARVRRRTRAPLRSLSPVFGGLGEGAKARS
jgi:hypothetical protein